MKIAIIGSGIAGLSTAWLLNKKYDITLFEKNNYLGGHSNTANIKYNYKKIAVDTGFIVFNFRTYPNLKAFFELLGVKIAKSNMSFAVRNLDNNFTYSGNNLAGLFAQKRNLFNPKFWMMLKDINKFNKHATALIEQDQNIDDNKTLNDFITELGLGDYFKYYYLLPMAGAIWSCPVELIKNYPLKTFLQFFYNHGLLTVTNQPQWYTVKGGSQEYVKKITASFADKINLNCKIINVQNIDNKIILNDDKGAKYKFDKVIFATHTDQTYKMIKGKTSEQKDILENIRYSKNIAVLHKDKEQMPLYKKAWASWVYLSSAEEQKVSLTYWMNNLQNIDHKYPLFVTLNPIKEIAKKDIFATYKYEHPIFDHDAIMAQKNLEQIQGQNNMWFCGAWTKYGFHEDGLNSALDIAQKFSVQVPWKK